MPLKLTNQQMRRLWLDVNGLWGAPVGELDVVSIIRRLGFVQLDSVQNVSRAHHHILWSRNQGYREGMLDDLLSSRRDIFEHFTHDASVLPMEFYPMWGRQFGRLGEKISKYKRYDTAKIAEWKDVILERIEAEGPLSTKSFSSKINGRKQVWSQPPHKSVLDYLWYTGVLSTSHREKFTKFYDLSERVIPDEYRERQVSDAEQVDWLCREALDRLSVGSVKEIQAFWDAKSLEDVKGWIEENDVQPVEWETASGRTVTSYASGALEERLDGLSSVSSRIRIINPFDPAIRDRARLKRIFGFDYKLEMFVPAPKRKWGYYVYPLLQGDQFVGRINLKADRKASRLEVLNFWPEEGIKQREESQQKVRSELSRFARLAGLEQVVWP